MLDSSLSPLPMCIHPHEQRSLCTQDPLLHSLQTLQRCWDARLCIAIVRKCHCWHLTRAGAPTQACLLATCGPTSSAADTGLLVCSPASPCHSPPKSACLAGPAPVKDQSGEHNSIYRSVFDWWPCRGVAAMQLHQPSSAARSTNTKLTLNSTPHARTHSVSFCNRKQRLKYHYSTEGNCTAFSVQNRSNQRFSTNTF